MVRWHHRLKGHESEQTQIWKPEFGIWHAVVHGVIKSQTPLSDNKSNNKDDYCSNLHLALLE